MGNKIKYDELRFEHVVAFSQEDTIFATGRENTGKTRIFLIFSNDHERVYTRNGVVESWELLNQEQGVAVINRITQAVADGVKIYRFEGSSHQVTGSVPGNN